MLDNGTKRRIDTARDILVGKLPDPKSQVEQITIALIYKFMDDMDAESEELGGERKFFTGDYARYDWAKLMRSGLGGYETLNLYTEAITKMQENTNIPSLFRNIFKNAYLPYRDPETLRYFLKIIDEFEYDHSERLGDAFEYLLSVLGSQGDAGQFRTPRHIIDFIVSIIDPQKDETILDPACGTAGFLISSYKHILKNNTDADGQIKLTPEEKGKLAQNLNGYDISPDMVRLSLVNMYLHGLNDPHIYEYDTLTSEDRWNEYADIIMANPPFMSPKGGIRPHNRFTVQSKRSEVLFVDYMAEHMTPNGRAGIIVPEGIIFQSQNAYKQLRKKLIEEALIAVISLPAGVFNPYSGVKTSILILDKSLAKKTDTIVFFKVENDGYGLGAQRRPIDKNDLPQVKTEIKEYLRLVCDGDSLADFQPIMGSIVDKEKIAVNGEYSLSGERYRDVAIISSSFPFIPLGDLCNISKGSSITRSQVVEGSIPVIAGGRKPSCYHNEPNRIGETITVSASGAYAGYVAYFNEPIFASDCSTIKPKDDRIITKFLFYILKGKQSKIYSLQVGMGQPHVYPKNLASIEIPLPPLDVQKEVVAEIENYQKVIDGARMVVDNYKPNIPIHPDWPVKQLGEITKKITDGTHRTPNYTENGVPFLRVTDITNSNTSKKFISEEEHRELIKRCHPEKGDILYSKNGTIGVARLIDWDWDFSIFVSLALIKPRKELIDSHFLTCYLNSESAFTQATARSKSGTVTNLHLVDIKTIYVPLPPLQTQQHLVAEIEAEQSIVNANRDLITLFDKKIHDTISRIWGEDKPATKEV